MANNVALNAGSGGDIIAANQIGTKKFQVTQYKPVIPESPEPA